MKRGFTLVEMITVAVIIALLVLIGCSVGLQAREKSRQARCISNLRQIGQAVRMYRDDWEGSDPAEFLPPTLLALCPTYLSDKRVLKCLDGFTREDVPTDYAYNYAPKGSDLRKPHDGHVAVLWPSLFRLRGEEYPIVYDLHHTSLLIRESKESFYMDIWHGPKLVLRLNGQVQAVTKRVITTAAL